MRFLTVLLALVLIGCGPTRVVTRTEVVEIPRLHYVPLPAKLTAPTVVAPVAPTCQWHSLPTLCVGQLAERCDALADAVESCNADKASIQSLQPE